MINISDINIAPKLIEIQRDINSWSKRDLTPFGKVVVIRTLLISKIVHIFISLPTPSKNTILNINKMLFEFLWDGKPDKIKRNIAKQKLERGGINMIDIDVFDKALKLTWIRRLILGKQKWKNLICFLNPDLNEIQCFGNVFVKRVGENINNLFWSNVMKYLFELINKC